MGYRLQLMQESGLSKEMACFKAALKYALIS